jgi:Protein of unknown function VcgC/VcgE (DUF2780)
MKTLLRNSSWIIILLVLFGAVQPVSADVTQLIGLLTGKLGVTGQQAEGGAGAIFDYVRQKLSPGDFSQVTDALPGVDSLMASAPAHSALTNKLGGSIPSLGGQSDSAAGMAGLTESFAKLGLNEKMVNEYVTVILDYAKSEGGETVMNLLKGSLL